MAWLHVSDWAYPAVVHSEIHNWMKPSEALPSQVFQVVVEVIGGQRAGKGTFYF